MGGNLVNLNVNPCKMCMPMGAASALYGLKNCMSILHGSQGCATYIRRHMATHYNEPIDIASSSLTEHGTVFGGEENLMKGLENLISLYHPEIIGVATTCLAETIGEDVDAIVRKFYLSHPDVKAKIINISSAGYGGTQYEGFFKTLRAVVSQVEMDDTPNELINIVTPMLSPADTRLIKNILDSMGLRYILLPDLSDNLDGIHTKKYARLKSGGTSLEAISKMAGARHTVELSLFAEEALSPAQYLYDNFGVPFTRLAVPVGIRDTDAWFDLLVSLGGTISASLAAERGRYLDAMIDSHKYCADGKAAIFGEPDFVYSMTRLCCENGIVPLVAATGSVCPKLRSMLEDEMKTAAEQRFIEKTEVLDDCDFDRIEALSKELGVNLMIGSSDGRRTAHRLHIGLIRCAFPVHDRVGGQRIKTVCYEGALNVLDQAANLLLGNKEETFREEIFNRFFDRTSQSKKEPAAAVPPVAELAGGYRTRSIEEKTMTHPCFHCSGSKYARIHLPIAPDCNIQCNYCVRKFDCPNESRPGVTTVVMTPNEAFQRYLYAKQTMENLTVVGIAGPGDALANFEKTKETLHMIRSHDPEVTFCLSTNGLMLPFYAKELTALGVSHVTVTMNAVDPEIGAKIYKHIDYMGHRYTGIAAASILLANQLAGLHNLASDGIVCKVNTVLIPGINDHHVEEVVKMASEVGSSLSNVMPLIPVKGSAFAYMEPVSNKDLHAIRNRCGSHLKQMYHCRQCRADAAGTLDNDLFMEMGSRCETKPKGNDKMKKFAVASKSGILVDQHFGRANEFYIYESDGNRVQFKEKRRVAAYCSGAENCPDGERGKIDSILSAISDCSSVLAIKIGDAPASKLDRLGMKAFLTYDIIEDAIRQAASQFTFDKEL